MKVFIKILCLLAFNSTMLFAQQKMDVIAVENGVSKALAQSRSEMIKAIQYQLHFSIPADKTKLIEGKQSISFELNKVPNRLQLDFKQPASYVKSISVNGVKIQVNLQNEHLLIDQQYLHNGNNQVSIDFTAGDESLNRNNDYLYALFVPDHARSAFPCFDQPDLKATFQLALTVPKGWKVLANGSKKDSLVHAKNITYHFETTERLPTYLFSFTAGQYKRVNQQKGKHPMELLHRETDPSRISLSVDSIFMAHQQAIQFLENWTAIPYPFQKVGFAAIPDFQFGGMEHPGVIHYKASSLFLGEGATRDQFISRSNLISHEIAHMWFGDLVTMKWFNDVWMKEVFANFIADKVTENVMGTATFNLKFLQDHYPAAYSIDRSRGANPIRQQLNNLQDAGSMYGNIIYHKAPIMMRQLELLMGEADFKKGIQAYLKKYAYQNATWDDLIAILSQYSKADLYKWNKIWVNQPGRPVFNAEVKYKHNKISSFKLRQRPEYGKQRVWPQQFTLRLYYTDHSKDVLVNMIDKQVNLKELKGYPKPNAILFNTDGMGYGLFPVDQQFLADINQVKDPLARASAYINAYENTISGSSFKPQALLELLVNNLNDESNEMNLSLMCNYLTTLYWSFTTSAERQAYAPVVEKALWNAMQDHHTTNPKKILFNAYQNIYLSADAQKRMYAIWQNKKAPAGVKLIDDDYTSLALSLALKTTTASPILVQELARINNADRKARLKFIMPALSFDVRERDLFFESLKKLENRQKESWVNAALSYLHHPLRQQTSVKYLPQSLELLQEIKETGDIFFPQSWLNATFSSYQMQEADEVVLDFLKKHPEYDSNLKDKILQATDNLYRNQHILNTGKKNIVKSSMISE